MQAVGQAELTPVLSKFCPVRFIWVNDTATFVQYVPAIGEIDLFDLKASTCGACDPSCGEARGDVHACMRVM